MPLAWHPRSCQAAHPGAYAPAQACQPEGWAPCGSSGRWPRWARRTRTSLTLSPAPSSRCATVLSTSAGRVAPVSCATNRKRDRIGGWATLEKGQRCIRDALLRPFTSGRTCPARLHQAMLCGKAPDLGGVSACMGQGARSEAQETTSWGRWPRGDWLRRVFGTGCQLSLQCRWHRGT